MAIHAHSHTEKLTLKGNTTFQPLGPVTMRRKCLLLSLWDADSPHSEMGRQGRVLYLDTLWLWCNLTKLTASMTSVPNGLPIHTNQSTCSGRPKTSCNWAGHAEGCRPAASLPTQASSVLATNLRLDGLNQERRKPETSTWDSNRWQEANKVTTRITALEAQVSWGQKNREQTVRPTMRLDLLRILDSHLQNQTTRSFNFSK